MDLARPITSVVPGLPGRVLGVLGRTDVPLTGRAVAKGMDPPASQAGVAKVLDVLVRDGIVLRTEAGTSAQFVLNREHLAAPMIEALAELRLTFVERVAAVVGEMQPPPLSAYLYGSVARGDGTPDSDVDIAFVVSDELTDTTAWDAATADVRRRVRAMTGNDVSLVEYRPRDLFGGDHWLVGTVRREGILLTGAPVDDLERQWNASGVRARRDVARAHRLTAGGRHADALGPLLAARDTYRDLGDRLAEATSLRRLVAAYAALGRWDEAAAALDDAVSTFRAVGDRTQAMAAMAELARRNATYGRHHEAVDLFEEALRLGRHAAADVRGRLHYDLGRSLNDSGQRDRALVELRRAVALLGEAGTVPERAEAAYLLASVLIPDPAAADAARDAVAMFREVGDGNGVAHALFQLALAMGDDSGARAAFEESLAMFRAEGDTDGEGLVLWTLGDEMRIAGDVVEGIRLLTEACDVFRVRGDAQPVAEILRTLGETYDDAGRRDEALDAYRRAFEASRLAGDTDGARSTRHAFERLHAKRQRPAAS
jgi:tetratricopeptide (TPR) repeat protein/predicted nucleotidyltransferase